MRNRNLLPVIIAIFAAIAIYPGAILGETSNSSLHKDSISASFAEMIVKLPSGAEGNWWAAAQKNIREMEYHITWRDKTLLNNIPAAYQAPNRAHNLRTYFTPSGVRVIPKDAEAPSWEWGLKLTGFGYAGNIRPVADAELVTSGNRIEYRRGELNQRRGTKNLYSLGYEYRIFYLQPLQPSATYPQPAERKKLQPFQIDTLSVLYVLLS